MPLVAMVMLELQMPLVVQIQAMAVAAQLVQVLHEVVLLAVQA
jgi:hypothetical protein